MQVLAFYSSPSYGQNTHSTNALVGSTHIFQILVEKNHRQWSLKWYHMCLLHVWYPLVSVWNPNKMRVVWRSTNFTTNCGAVAILYGAFLAIWLGMPWVWQEAYLSSLIESQNSCFPQGRTPGWWSDSEGILMTRHNLKLHVVERWNSKWMCLCWDIFCKRNYIANTYRAIVSHPV